MSRGGPKQTAKVGHFIMPKSYALDQLSAEGSVKKLEGEFVVEAEMEGASARELNRTFLFRLERGREKNDASRRMDFGRRHHRTIHRLRLEE